MKYTVNKDAVTYRILDGEAIIINKKTSYFYTLNKTATFIWELLIEQELTLENLVKKTSQHYQKNEKEINEDISKIVTNLAKNDLFKRINSTTKTRISSDKKGPAGKDQTKKYETPAFTKYEKLERLIVASV